LRTGLCIVLLAAGAIFLFAFPGKVLEINLHVMGFILICTGLLGLILRRPSAPVRGLLERWAIPHGWPGPWESPDGEEIYVDEEDDPATGTFGTEPRSPTLADDLLHAKSDPPP
jgi:hypothetical protein